MLSVNGARNNEGGIVQPVASAQEIRTSLEKRFKKVLVEAFYYAAHPKDFQESVSVKALKEFQNLALSFYRDNPKYRRFIDKTVAALIYEMDVAGSNNFDI